MIHDVTELLVHLQAVQAGLAEVGSAGHVAAKLLVSELLLLGAEDVQTRSSASMIVMVSMMMMTKIMKMTTTMNGDQIMMVSILLWCNHCCSPCTVTAVHALYMGCLFLLIGM